MGKYSKLLCAIQEVRLKKSREIGDCESEYDIGFKDGFNNAFLKIEEVVNEFQIGEAQKARENGERLWYKGSPEDIKQDNRDDYVVIIRPVIDISDEIKYGDIYISADYWDGKTWETYYDPSEWEVLYFTKLKWLHFPIPSELGLKKSESMFLK